MLPPVTVAVVPVLTYIAAKSARFADENVAEYLVREKPQADQTHRHTQRAAPLVVKAAAAAAMTRCGLYVRFQKCLSDLLRRHWCSSCGTSHDSH